MRAWLDGLVYIKCIWALLFALYTKNFVIEVYCHMHSLPLSHSHPYYVFTKLLCFRITNCALCAFRIRFRTYLFPWYQSAMVRISKKSKCYPLRTTRTWTEVWVARFQWRSSKEVTCILVIQDTPMQMMEHQSYVEGANDATPGLTHMHFPA